MASPFEKYDFNKANEAFTAVKAALAKTASSRKFIEGDDWQNGAGWVGPQFEGNTKISRDLKEAIAREFTSKGSIKSAVRRHRRGVIGRVPSWQISSRNASAEPTSDDATDDVLIGEAQTILNEFWKNSRVHQTLKDFVTDYLVTGRAVLRLFFVQSDDGEAGTAAVADSISGAVKLLHLFKEKPESGCVVWDKETLKKASLFRYERGGKVFIELCYVDDDGATIFKTLTQDGDANFARTNFPTSLGRYANGDERQSETEGLPLPLDGKLLVFELEGEPFVSGAMRSQQKLVNKAFTMLSHNLDVSGFRERVYLNAMPPGTVEVVNGEKIFKPNPEGIEVGAGKVGYTQGIKYSEKDANGNVSTTLTTPQIFESDPIPVKTYADSAAAAGEAILEEADQKHIAISGDAVASGESRIQARDEFQQSLEDTKSPLDDVGSEVFECVLAVVAYLMGEDDKYADLQVTFNAILNPGPVSAEQRNISMDEADKKYRSRESAMEQIGITDPDAMKAKIKQETDELPPPPIVPPVNPPQPPPTN